MSQAYKPDSDLSTEALPPPDRKRLLVYLALAVVAFGGVGLLIALALGLANPPRAGSLTYEVGSPASWQPFPDAGQSRLFAAPNRLPVPPFTIEMTATNQGGADSGWGFWSLSPDGMIQILMSQDGYFSYSDDGSPHWAQFIHIQPDINTLSINVTEDRQGTVRINDEIVWTGAWVGINRWGASQYSSPALNWQGIRVYNG